VKKLRTNSILSSILMILVGIFLFVYPGRTLDLAVRIVGIALLVLGAVGILSYVLGGKKDGGAAALTAPVLAAAAGLVLLIAPGFVLSILPFVAGVLIVITGASRLLEALTLRRRGGSGAPLAILLSVVTILLGIVIIFNPFKTLSLLVKVLGVIVIYTGVSGLLIAAKAK